MDFNQGQSTAKSAGFGGVERNDGAVFLSPGLHEVTISKVEYITPDTAKPYIAVTLGNDLGSTTQRFYVSPQAVDQTLINLVHLFNKVASDDQMNALTWPDGDWAAMASAVTPLVCTGQSLRIKLSGEEYNGRINAKFGWKPFAEAISANPSRLTFNEASDVKMSESANITSGVPGTPGAMAPKMPSAPSIPQ
jgi:hypothetical protein